MAGEMLRRLWRQVSGANARQRKREEEQRRAEEREQWIAHERMMNRLREANRREMVRALTDPDIVPSVKARLFEELYRK